MRSNSFRHASLAKYCCTTMDSSSVSEGVVVPYLDSSKKINISPFLSTDRHSACSHRRSPKRGR